MKKHRKSQRTLQQGEEKTSANLPKGSETILVVEDDAAIRRLARKSLVIYGYTVLEAKGGQEALKIGRAYEKRIHLLLSDVIMPGISGRELADRLQFIIPELKVIYMSGYADDAISRYGVLDPKVNFIEKPFLPEDLARRVREVLDRED